MIEIRKIDEAHQKDINLPNEPFPLFGRMLPAYRDGQWSYTVERWGANAVKEMCFSDESCDFSAMSEEGSVFLGAYDGETCVGLAILQPGFFKYMYLYDLKVSGAYRGQGVGQRLIERAKEIAAQQNYRGLYTQGQDNNPGRVFPAGVLFYSCGVSRCSSNMALTDGAFFVSFLMLRSSALLLARRRLFSDESCASLIFCRCVMVLSISSIAVWKRSLAMR